jgi:CDP-glycerol glycerophosphotransferase (TagB/SpsB family)
MIWLRKWAPQWLKDCALLLSALAIGALSLVPKRRGSIAFYSTFNPDKFAGNLREVFLLGTKYPRYDFVWLTNDRETAQRLSDAGLKAKHYTFFPLWPLLRAEKIVLDNLVRHLSFGRFRLFQLWHGTGFKNIGLLNEKRRGLLRFVSRRHYRMAEMVLASSKEDAARKEAAFLNGNLLIAGSPRNDRLLAAPHERARRGARFSIPEGKRLIAYCPTFRETNARHPFTSAFWPALDARLSRENAAFVVKKHPRDAALTVPTGFRNIMDVSKVREDVQDLLSIADILVTDYSAISTDFVLTGKPIVFYTYDQADYERDSRTFYYDLKEVLPGPFAQTEDELSERVFDSVWFDGADYQARYAAFRSRFHAFLDAGAAERVAASIVDA